jgi:hypothetical protein
LYIKPKPRDSSGYQNLRASTVWNLNESPVQEKPKVEVKEPETEETSAEEPKPAIKTNIPFANLQVFTGTWNLGDTAPVHEQISQLFEKDIYDIIAVGVQECKYKPAPGYANVEEDWFGTLEKIAGSNYFVVSSASLRDSIRLIVLAKNDHKSNIRNAESAIYSTSVPVFWRKGGVGVSFMYDSTSVCFINCHMAAHQNEILARNTDAVLISKNLKLGNKNYDVTHQFHHTFWIGDLNYRINLTKDEVVQYLDKKDYDGLYQRDQFRTEQEKGKVLVNFKEGKIAFRPTFKFDRGTLTYSVTVARIPSWCDRVLYQSLDGLAQNLAQSEYSCVESILSSDHIPVRASFTLKVPLDHFPASAKWHRFTIKITELSYNVTNLLGVVLNPRVIFTGPTLEREPIKSTIAISKTQHQFPDDAVAPFFTKLLPREGYLENQHLFVAIYHYRGEGREELLGQGCVCYKNHLLSSSTFTVKLYDGGLCTGTVSARMEVSL